MRTPAHSAGEADAADASSARRARILPATSVADARSVRGLRAEVFDAIDRVDRELLDVHALQDAQRDVGPGGAAAPDLAVELRLRAHAVAADRRG